MPKKTRHTACTACTDNTLSKTYTSLKSLANSSQLAVSLGRARPAATRQTPLPQLSTHDTCESHIASATTEYNSLQVDTRTNDARGG